MVNILWEHYILNELTAQLQTAGGRYRRDKQGHEVDLIPLAAREKSDGQRMQMVRS
jgi:predicted AAA+ superfamily ATPase